MKAPDNTKDHYAPILGMDLEKVVGGHAVLARLNDEVPLARAPQG